MEDLEGVTHEHSAKYDSQANGGTEVGIRALRGQFRTLRLCLERRVGRRIPARHPLTSWLLEHTALLLNASVRGEDGLTSWARVRGRPFGQRLIGFGESVLWKLPTKGPQHDEAGNMASRMLPGVFLGYNRLSNVYRVAVSTGEMVESRALQRRPMEDRWKAEELEAVTATPCSLRNIDAPDSTEFGDKKAKYDVPLENAPMVPRRLKITMKTLQEYGTTDGCRQCDHIKAFGEVKGGLAHGDRCRTRIVEAMGKTEKGMAKLKEIDEKLDKALMEQVTAPSAAPPAEPPAALEESLSSQSHDPVYSGVRGGMSLPADEAQSAETPAPKPPRGRRTGLSSVAPRARELCSRPPGPKGRWTTAPTSTSSSSRPRGGMSLPADEAQSAEAPVRTPARRLRDAFTAGGARHRGRRCRPPSLGPRGPGAKPPGPRSH